MVMLKPMSNKNKYLNGLLAGIFLLQFAHITIVILSDISPGFPGQTTLLKLFFVGEEANIPAWFESCLFLICSALLMVISWGKRSVEDRFWRHWLVLAVIFVLLSLDEIASLHEMTIPVMRKLLGEHELLYYPWVVLGAIFIIVLLFVYAKFLLALDARVRLQFIVAGIVFVSGSIGMEVLEGYLIATSSGTGSYSGWLQGVEEFLEMFGLWLFIRALIHYFSHQGNSVKIEFS